MAPHKKKKKNLSNPARGFATVSQPSKQKDLNEPYINVSLSVPQDVPVEPAAQDEVSDMKCIEQASQIPRMTPEELEIHLEDSELQNVLESHAFRCKQDASRQVNRLLTERRQLRAEAHKLPTMSWLSDEVVNKVLKCWHEREAQSNKTFSRSLVDNIELLLRLWTLRIVLHKLHFKDIDTALTKLLIVSTERTIPVSLDHIWGLQEVLQWYAVEHDQIDLPDYDYHAPTSTAPTNDEADNAECEISVDQEDKNQVKIADQPAPAQHSFDIKEVTGFDDLVQLSSSESEDCDPSALTEKYIRLQTLLFRIETRLSSMQSTPSNLVRHKIKLQDRIDKINRDILFEKKEAELLWQHHLRQLKIEISKTSRSEYPISKARDNQSKSGSTGQDGDEIHLGDMFSAVEEETLPQRQSIESNAVRIVDFGKWTGVSPRRLLEESCLAIDSGPALKFVPLMLTSYSSKYQIELHWPIYAVFDAQALSALPEEVKFGRTGNKLALEMVSIATTTATQAESYLSTITLFLLIESGCLEHKQSTRLPTIWRNLYNNLGRERQKLVDITDRNDLKLLRKLIHDTQRKLSKDQTSIAVNEDIVPKLCKLSSRIARDRQHIPVEEVRSQWSARLCSPTYQAMLETRKQLPVHKYKHNIIDLLQQNQLIIISADTGAGKSTQVPSFVLEHELCHGKDCRILVTQPRRISAISLARRVSQELGEGKKDLGTDRSLVGYTIRMESRTSKSTRITYATTGVVLRMMEASPDLDELDCLILDEIHERTMDIDLLFIALKRLQQRRSSLKIILMSATLDAEKFSSYFNGAPTLKIPGRTFPVEIRYLEDAIEDTLDVKLPDYQSSRHADETYDTDIEGNERIDLVGLDEYSSRTRSKLTKMDEHRIDYELTAALVETIATKEKYRQYSSAILIFMPGIAEIRRLHNTLLDRKIFSSKWVIHLLHSSFSTEDLERAFIVPAPAVRKIVIATNIAETGVTIPDITAVIDTCKEKIMRFDERRQLSRLTEGFISRSSARQRRGRAARVRSGLCFHLVTRHRFENTMLEQHIPEMLRLSLQDPILRIKIWNLGSIEETLAAAIDPPTPKNIRRAIDKLKTAGALGGNEELTHLGTMISRLPLEVVLSKLAIFGMVFKCLDGILTIVAVLLSKSPFLPHKSDLQVASRFSFARGDSDLISTLNAYQGWRKATKADQGHQFCRRYHISDQGFSAIEDQKIQLLVYLVDAGFLHLSPEEKANLDRSRISSSRKAFFHIPDRCSAYESDTMLNCVVAMAFYPRIITREGKGWRNVYSNQRVNLTPDSVIRATDKPPKWLCFYEAMQVRSGTLNVLETSRVPELVIVTMLGCAETKFFSGVIVLDSGRVRFCVRHWRQLAAIKLLRETLADVLVRGWQIQGLELSHSDEVWVKLFAEMAAGEDAKSR